jgi:transcriptional regulator with XRE-family HTH domain
MNYSKSGTGRRRWTDKQRQRLLARFHDGQLTQRDFAGKHGVGLSTLSKWLRVESEAPPTTAPPLTPKQADTTVKLPVDLWKKAGFATPEDTLKTRGWAIVNGDRQEFTQSIYLTDGARKMIEDQVLQMAAASKDPEAPRIAQQALAENWGAEEAVLMPMMAANQNNPYTDYTILSQQSPSDDEDDMVVQTETSSGAPTTETLKFQRFGDTWKIVIDEAAVAHK